MEAAPSVSVVIPTKDRPEFVDRALDAVLGQRGVSLEVIVVDDGTAGGTPVRVLDRARGDDRLRVIRHDVSTGVARARNDGIAAARGGWVAFLDDDDLWSPDKLQIQLDVAAGSGAGLIYGEVLEVDERLVPLRRMGVADPSTLRRDLLGECVVPTPSVVMAKTSVVLGVGGFDDRLRVLADWDLWLRVVTETSAACSAEVLSAYVRHPGSMLTVERDQMLAELDRMRTKHAGAAAAAGVALGDRFLIRFEAQGQLDRGDRRGAARTYARYGLATRRLRYAARSAGALVSPEAQDRVLALKRRFTPSPAWLAPYSAA